MSKRTSMEEEFIKISENLFKSNVYGDLHKRYRQLHLKLSSLELHKSFDIFDNSAIFNISSLLTSKNIERRSINGLVELDGDNLHLINEGFSNRLSSPLPIHITARKLPQKLTFEKAELAAGAREINTGQLRHYFENYKDVIYLDLGVPQDIMNKVWETIVGHGEYEVILCICVNIFQRDMGYSFSGSPDRQNFFIESNNYYHAFLETIHIRKRTSIAKNEIEPDENKINIDQEEFQSEEENSDEPSLSQFTKTIFLPSMHVIADDFRHLILVLWAIVAILLISLFL